MSQEVIEQEEQDLFEHFRLVVDKGQSLLRIDKFLMNRMENVSRNRIQNAADAGNILVNAAPVKSSYKVKPLDVISIVLPEPPRDTEIYPEDIQLNIAFEDDHLVIVNKPAGMVVHPGFNNYTGTLVHALAFHFQNLPNLKGNVARPGLVHRIDKDTSGLLLISKDEMAMTYLAKQFYDHSITRKYIALVWGDISEDGSVEGYIGRSLRDRKVMDVFDTEENGKWSKTHYKVLERFHYTTLIECQLETGRTHQIRAHMQHIGHPLFSDASYGGDKVLKGQANAKYNAFVSNAFDLCPRQALHAQSIGFIHPFTKEYIQFESDLPDDMQALINKWRKYSNDLLK
jgi:23S rRNA pseudouridine1911/1915/1917 synthase